MDLDDLIKDSITQSLEDATSDSDLEPELATDRPPVLSLVIFHSNGVRIVPLPPTSAVTIGRAPPVDVLISDNTLSRQHARFELVGEAVIVEDLNSTNGVWLEDERIQRKVLQPGSEISMGRLMVSIQLLSLSKTPMNRLISHDQFVSLLEEGVSRARNLGSSLAVLHVQASLHAVKVSQWIDVLFRFLRPVDQIALYSNTALVIFQPDAGEHEASNLAGLVQQQTWREDQSDPQLRFGISTFPDSAATAQGLLQASRHAFRKTTTQQRVRVAPPQNVRKARTSDQVQPVMAGDAVVGSPAMKEVYDAVDRLAKTEIPVLLVGETGTGKEVVTRAIHERSRRRDKGLCCINCASLPESLVESTLFGHVRGAFTGADRDARGIFEEAEGGTVLLDEIAELPLPMQAKLLRVIETKQFNPVGSARTQSMNVRIITATNRNLEEMCTSGLFRWDLFYRINTMTLRIPPLRERPEEIPLLVEHFINQANQEGDLRVDTIEADALQLLEAYHWPGNVRELRNVIERAVVLAQQETILVEDLPERVRLYHGGVPRAGEHQKEGSATGGYTLRSIKVTGPLSRMNTGARASGDSLDYRTQLQRFEVQLIHDVLQQTGGNQTEAAKLLNISLRTLVRKIKALGLGSKRDQGATDDGNS